MPQVVDMNYYVKYPISINRQPTDVFRKFEKYQTLVFYFD